VESTYSFILIGFIGQATAGSSYILAGAVQPSSAALTGGGVAAARQIAWLKNQVEDIFSACIIRKLFAVEVMRRLPKNLAV
jgi:hypothetical protein